MHKKLLSICIPTYNRASILEGTLNSIFSNPDFDSTKIEVIVSDNLSTDDTALVVSKFPLVHYYRNDENVRDRNFLLVLGYAKGIYIRLFNDTVTFKPKALGIMLSAIERHLKDGINLFFYENMFLNQNCQKIITSKEMFLSEVSFYNTWISNFGLWREDFHLIENKDRYVDLQFIQVDLNFRILENSKKTIIYFQDFFEVIKPSKKGGYNLFDTFINKYLYVIKQEELTLYSYEIEKYRLCRYFIYTWFMNLIVKDKQAFDFDVKRFFRIMIKKYWYEPYFYPILLICFLHKSRIKSIYKN